MTENIKVCPCAVCSLSIPAEVAILSQSSPPRRTDLVRPHHPDFLTDKDPATDIGAICV